MARWFSAFSRALAIAVPLSLGGLSIVFSDQLAQPPAAKERARPSTPVRVVTVEPIRVTPRVVGYGKVAPVHEWRAVSRLEGAIVSTYQRLEPGEVVPQGTPLVQIEDADIRLSLAQADAQLASFDVRQTTLIASLDLARRDLELSQAELVRQQELAGRGVVSEAVIEQAQRQQLSVQGRVVEIENQLALNEAERRVLSAQRALAERSLEFTTIVAPYDLRLTSVNAETGQVITRGQTLLSGEGIEAVEVAAQFPMGRLGPVVRALQGGGSVLDLHALVRLPAAGHLVTWKAQVDRVTEAIDPRTQSTGIVVRIDGPLAQAEAGKRPPLRRNTLVEVELSAPTVSVLALPVEAIRDDSVLIVTDEGKLTRRSVSVGYRVEGLAVIDSGLSPGDRVVVTDPSIAVVGMDVKPVEDQALKAEMARMALGSEKAE